ncbi:MAG: sodium:proton antiporter NhaD [Candidatus Azosocius agrarius]|nr:MAG: sodium:proton antiporter NhaD [Gammaproteobacteria bacterium]
MNFVLKNSNMFLSLIALLIFFVSYILVIFEEYFSIKKFKPVILAAGLIWLIIGIICYNNESNIFIMKNAINNYFYNYINLFLFLLVSMVYINILKKRDFFLNINKWIFIKKINSKQLFLFTGFLSFLISPIADNLTTALLISSIIVSVDENNKKFINLCCINIVIASNAGGAFSPFGDITTLMVWQSEIVHFTSFFKIFIPSFISFIIPSIVIYFFIEKKYFYMNNDYPIKKIGNKRIVFLFILTIIIAIIFEHFLFLPASIGMMTGFGFLCFFGYYINFKEKHIIKNNIYISFDIIKYIETIEWDTLLFFYGIIMSIGGLATLGYLNNLSFILYKNFLYNINYDYNITFANVLIGILSAFIDNIPVMFSIIIINPNMSEYQWLLITLTTGIGGSILSIGSAAGIALMGQNKKIYTFISHLKWSWIIIVGYLVGIAFHILINKY